jgi:RecJ-like exonuclease
MGNITVKYNKLQVNSFENKIHKLNNSDIYIIKDKLQNSNENTMEYCYKCDGVIVKSIIKHCIKCNKCHNKHKQLYCKICDICINPYDDSDVFLHRKKCKFFKL